jgi:hypothetical protein
MNGRQNFLNLLKYAIKLKKNKESLLEKDPETFDALLKFLIITEEH